MQSLNEGKELSLIVGLVIHPLPQRADGGFFGDGDSGVRVVKVIPAVVGFDGRLPPSPASTSHSAHTVLCS